MRFVLNQRNMFSLWLILAVTFVTVELTVTLINISFFGKPSSWYHFLFQPLTYFLWILFLPLVFVIQTRFSESQDRLSLFLFKHLLTGIAVCLLHRMFVELAMVGLLGALDPVHAHRIHPLVRPEIFALRVLTGGLSNVFLYVISLVIVLLIGYQERLKDALEQRFQAERDKAKAELRALKMQFSPHFLLNSLNGAVSLVERQQPEAVDYLLCLGEMLQYTMAQQLTEAVTLIDEVGFAQNYLAVQEMRFGERLQVRFAVDDDVMQAKVPPLLLQPLIENAVKHGLEGGSKPCSVAVCAGRKDARLFLEVANSLQPQPGVAQSGTGTGLQNLRERLKLFYGNRALFETRADDAQFVARLEVDDA